MVIIWRAWCARISLGIFIIATIIYFSTDDYNRQKGIEILLWVVDAIVFIVLMCLGDFYVGLLFLMVYSLWIFIIKAINDGGGWLDDLFYDDGDKYDYLM